MKQTSWMMALFFSSSLDNNLCQKQTKITYIWKDTRKTMHTVFMYYIFQNTKDKLELKP